MFIENSTDKTKGLIHFNRPRGNFDQIHLRCSAQDRRCLEGISILENSINNCSNCTFISISPITRGIQYKCEAWTMKTNFQNVTSAEYNFTTSE